MQILALRPVSCKPLKPSIHFGWVNRDYPNNEISTPTSLPEKPLKEKIFGINLGPAMFFGGLFLAIFTGAFFSSTGTGKARIALNNQYSHASSALSNKEGLQSPLFNKQASLATYFRNAAITISAYSKDEQLKYVVSLMDEANLTEEEKDYTMSFIKSEESNPGGFKKSYENFDRWLDKVIAPRVESSQLAKFKTEAKTFYEYVDKNDFLANDIPTIIFITGLLSAVGLGAYKIIKP